MEATRFRKKCACIDAGVRLAARLSVSDRSGSVLLKGNVHRPGGIRIAGSGRHEVNALARRRESPEKRLLDPPRRDRFGLSRSPDATALPRAIVLQAGGDTSHLSSGA